MNGLERLRPSLHFAGCAKRQAIPADDGREFAADDDVALGHRVLVLAGLALAAVEDEVRLGGHVGDAELLERLFRDGARERRRLDRQLAEGRIGERRTGSHGRAEVDAVDRNEAADLLSGALSGNAVADAKACKGKKLGEGAGDRQIGEALLDELDAGDEVRVGHVFGIGLVEEKEDGRLPGGGFLDPGVEHARGRHDRGGVVRIAEVDDRDAVKAVDGLLERRNVGLKRILLHGHVDHRHMERLGIARDDPEGRHGLDDLNLLSGMTRLFDLRFDDRLQNFGRAPRRA